MATSGTTGTLRDELAALRTGAGLVDRSDVGRLRITGADALDLLNRLTTNKLEELPDGAGKMVFQGRVFLLAEVRVALGDEGGIALADEGGDGLGRDVNGS